MAALRALLLCLLVPLAYCATVWTTNDVQSSPSRNLDTRIVDGQEECVLPASWEGSWHQFDLGTLDISRSQVSHKGRCVAARITQHLRSYLFHYQTKSEDCWRCLVIFPHHHNVLKYKETRCQPKGTLGEVCAAFYGDAPLHSLFRLDAEPEPCPLRPPLNFTYSFYRGECRTSTSWVASCASAATLRFDYQACPESWRADSKVEDVECLGSWSEKREKFFLGRIVNAPDFRPGANFRCFVYERTAAGGRIGVSADATCKSLFNVDSAATRLDFVRSTEPKAQCSFAKWLRKDQGQWDSLASETQHTVHKSLWVTRKPRSETNESTALCISGENFGRVHKYLVYKTDGCDRGYQCLKAVRRTKQIVEISRGAMARFPDEACTEEFFTEGLLEYDTLLLRDSVETECPSHGRYRIHGCTEDSASVSFGCTAAHQLVVNLECVEGRRETFNCHGHWEEAGAEFLVVKEQHTGKRSCYAYTRTQSAMAMSGFYRHPCRQGLLDGLNGRRVYNATRAGVCDPVSAAWSSGSRQWPTAGLALLSLLPALLRR